MNETRPPNPYAPPGDLAGCANASVTEGRFIDLQHVLAAVNFAIMEKRRHDDERVQVDAREICRMVLALACRMTAYDPSGAEAFVYLAEMNLWTSEDVGRAIEVLDRNGLTRPSENDHPSDFNELFDLETPIADWRLHFDLAREMEFACQIDDAGERE